MAHEISGTDTVVSTTREWHSLEHRIEEGLSPLEAVRKAIPWVTAMVPVFGKFEEFGKGFATVVEATDYRMHVRTDTLECLGIVGKDYQVVPNQVLGEFAEALAGADAQVRVETCGSLRAGRRVFLCAKLAGDIEASKGDYLNKYLTLTNAHDGTAAFRAYFCTVRIVCMNTMRYSEKAVGNGGFSFRHDGNLSEKLEEAKKLLGLVSKTEEKVRAEIQRLVDCSVNPVEVNQYFLEVYTDTFGKNDMSAASEDILAFQDRRKEVLGRWHENLANDPAYGTAWGALNAVTEYHDHQRGRGTPRERALTSARFNSNMFGASANDKAIAYNAALQLV